MDLKKRPEFFNRLKPFNRKMNKFKKCHMEMQSKKPKSLVNMSRLLSPLHDVTMHYSKTPFKSLSLTSLVDLTDFVPEKGMYVILRILILPIRESSGLYSVVEDHSGNIVLVCLGNFNDCEAFSPGTVFIMKEPFLVIYPELPYYSVFSFSVTDVIPITRASKLYPTVANQSWRTIISGLGPSPDTAIGWKEQGNDYFRQKAFNKALDSYLVSLNMSVKSKDEILMETLHLNLTATYLELGCYETTLSYAKKVSNNCKAYYRAGRAYYEMRQYRKSVVQFSKLLYIDSSNKLGGEWMDKSMARLEENNKFTSETLEMLHSLSISHPQNRLDCANYIRHIKKLTPTSVIASEDILPGTILVVSKAISAFLSEPIDSKGKTVSRNHYDKSNQEMMLLATQILKEDTNGRKFLTNVTHQSLKELVTRVSQMIIKNPNTLGEKVFKFLSSRSDVERYCEGGSKELAIDVQSLLECLNKECFITSPLDYKEASAGLFISPSTFNQSCFPNARMEAYNDIMVIRTVAFIEKGQEVFCNRHTDHWCLRPIFSWQYHNCTCVVCVLDRKEPAGIKKKKAALTRQFQTMFADGSYSDLGNLVERMKEIYVRSGRTQFQIDLFHPYLVLSEYYWHKKGFGDALYVADQALAVLGLDRYTLLKCVEEDSAFPVFPDHVLGSVWILGVVKLYMLLYQNSNQNNINTWHKCYSRLYKLFFGIDISV